MAQVRTRIDRRRRRALRHDRPRGAHGDGAIFKITKSGKLSIVYSFNGGPDGAEPAAGLINDGGTLYGTTSGGGATGNGTVFSSRRPALKKWSTALRTVRTAPVP